MATFLSSFIPVAICNAIRVITGIIFIVLIIRNLKNNPIGGFVGMLYSMLVLWTLILVFRLFIEDIESFRGVTFNNKLGQIFLSDNFLPYLLPLLLLCLGRNREIDFGYFINVSKIFGIIYLVFLPYAMYSMMTFKVDMSVASSEADGYATFVNQATFGIIHLLPAFVTIYFKKYLTKKEWWIFMGALIGALLIGLYMARRGRSAIYVLYFVSCWTLYLLSNKNSSKFTQILGGVLIATVCYMIFTNSQDSFFSILMERGTTDSRTGIEENMIADMHGWDWIIGRGLFGTYYDPSFGYSRPDIETGYLALILKGGIIYLFCFVAILLMSAYKGLFKSRNLFIKAFAIIMIIAVIDLYPFGWPKFNFHYFTVWMGVYICNKQAYRNLTDSQIYNMYFKKK
jgi:hypothetical protein